MTRTVIALFDDFASASAAVRELVDRGFSRDDISLMASDTAGDYSRSMGTTETETTDTATTQGAGVGAGIGAALGGLGGLLVGLGALAIPGIGPVVAAGPLAAALTGLAGAGVGAVAGGVTGGLIGALVDMGVPEETAQYYAEGIRRGGHLVTVRAGDNMSDTAVDILNRHNPIDINERAAQWRESGWTTFDPNAEPYRRSENMDMDTHLHDRGVMETGAQDRGGWDASTRADYESTNTGLSGSAGGGETVYGTTSEPGMHDMEHAGEPIGRLNNEWEDYDAYDPRFRNHFQTTMTGAGDSYDQFQPAYRYGYDLATDRRYADYDWDRLEPEARRYWEERNPGTWDRFKASVRHAWEEIKDAVD